ncbi:hypothetical protein Acr_00g0020090 [Actinidia rufa]|uniref:Retrotransposon gag domain-containing protein n=1 Tax=Actinidia rufa TaxID=165716 RepID=A0A7J0DBW9_9ERIC|nr:hypothetical protein Acr_00g0020090 [Actinidia rufa]
MSRSRPSRPLRSGKEIDKTITPKWVIQGGDEYRELNGEIERKKSEGKRKESKEKEREYDSEPSTKVSNVITVEDLKHAPFPHRLAKGYSDADWGGDVDKSKSTSGWLLLIGNGVVSWSSKKQTIIAQSTMEAEYVSLSEAAKEAIWLKNFLVELAIPEVEARITLGLNEHISGGLLKPRGFTRAHLVRFFVGSKDLLGSPMLGGEVQRFVLPLTIGRRKSGLVLLREACRCKVRSETPKVDSKSSKPSEMVQVVKVAYSGWRLCQTLASSGGCWSRLEAHAGQADSSDKPLHGALRPEWRLFIGHMHADEKDAACAGSTTAATLVSETFIFGSDAFAWATGSAAMLVNLPIFRGVLNENPYTHVELFEEIVSTVRVDVNIRTEWVKLRLFPFSLKERAKEWFNMLRPGSIRTWVDLQKEFYKKYFPMSRTTQLKRAVTLFEGRPGESFHKVWERFNECVNAIPHHGFTVSQLVSSFYEGLTSEQRQFVEALSNGRFLSKTPEEAWDYFDELAANNQTWEMAGTTEPTRATGKYILHDVGDDDVRTQLAKLTRQLEMLTTKKVHEVSTKESHTQALNDIRSHLSKLTTSMGVAQNERGKFPSQPQPNPQGQHSIGSSNEGHMEHLKAVTTLRSGREVDQTIYPKVTNTIGLRTAPIPSYGERPNVSVEKLEKERNVKKDESVENDQVGGKAHEGVGVRNNGEGKNVG